MLIFPHVALMAALTPPRGQRKLGPVSAHRTVPTRAVGGPGRSLPPQTSPQAYRLSHAAQSPNLAPPPAARGVLHLRSVRAALPAGADVPADRLRAELPVPAVGVLPRPGRQRGAGAAAGPAAEP